MSRWQSEFWGNTVLQDVRFSLRSLVRNPGFAVAAVFTLALGIGANTAIFSLVRGVLLRPLPYPNADRVVALWERNPAEALDRELVRPGDFADWRNRSHSFEQFAFNPAEWMPWNYRETLNRLSIS
jgi:putative ABC transport system permease protein